MHSELFSQRQWFHSLALLLLLTGAAHAQRKETAKKANPVEAAALEYAIDGDALAALVGQECTLLLNTGKREEQAVVKKFLTGREPDRFRVVEVSFGGEKKTRKYTGDKIYQMEFAEQKLRLNYLPLQKMYVLEDVAKRAAAIDTQLKAAEEETWTKEDPAKMQGYVEEEKSFLKKVGEHFPNLNLHLVETEYFLFYTDMPAAQVAPYVRQLDKMSEALGQAFGFAPGENVWRGKAVVVVFVEQAAFQEFEKEFMENEFVPDSTQGLCHQSSDGRVVTSCWRGNDPSFFAAVLVHETAHGYMHRYFSTVHIPTWLNEGIAEWIATVAVPGETEMQRRIAEAADTLRRSKKLGPFYAAQTLDRWQYGAAHAIVQGLMKQSPQQFKLFFNGIKEGLKWEDSLERAYGITKDELTAAYGRSVGVPQLTADER